MRCTAAASSPRHSVTASNLFMACCSTLLLNVRFFSSKATIETGSSTSYLARICMNNASRMRLSEMPRYTATGGRPFAWSTKSAVKSASFDEIVAVSSKLAFPATASFKSFAASSRNVVATRKLCHQHEVAYAQREYHGAAPGGAKGPAGRCPRSREPSLAATAARLRRSRFAWDQSARRPALKPAEIPRLS